MACYSHIMFDLQIREMLDHHMNTYQYCGEPGREYLVIQSVFSQLNNMRNVNNAHIRWYAIIVHLERLFQKHYLSRRLPVPSFMDKLELFIELVADLGIMISSKLRIESEYASLKCKNLNKTLIELIDFTFKENDLHPDYNAFTLTIIHAARNAKKLEEYCGSDIEASLGHTFASEKFQTIMHRASENISDDLQRHVFNMDDFWNGFIP